MVRDTRPSAPASTSMRAAFPNCLANFSTVPQLPYRRTSLFGMADDVRPRLPPIRPLAPRLLPGHCRAEYPRLVFVVDAARGYLASLAGRPHLAHQSARDWRVTR